MSTNRRRIALFGLPLLALGAVATVAIAAPQVGEFGGDGPGWRGHHGHHDVQSAGELRDHMEIGADFLLARVDATDAQEAQVEAILDEVAGPAFELKLEGQDLREEVRASLDGGAVDAAALESARTRGLDLADRASALALDTFVDVANVLTPEQRAELSELHQRMHR